MLFICCKKRHTKRYLLPFWEVWNPIIFNIIRWLAGSLGRTTHPTRVWCSKHYFFFMISYRLRALKTLHFYFCKIKKNKEINWNYFFQRILQEIMKKDVLGTSDAWVVCPRDPATQIAGFYTRQPAQPGLHLPHSPRQCCSVWQEKMVKEPSGILIAMKCLICSSIRE